MVIDAGAGQAPLGELVILGQRRQGWPLDGLIRPRREVRVEC